MNLDNKFSWALAQSGKVSVSHQQLRGIVMNKVHIQCDCLSDSLLSDIAHADIQGDARDQPTWLDTQLKRRKEALEAAAAEAAEAAEAAAAAAADNSDGVGGRVSGGRLSGGRVSGGKVSSGRNSGGSMGSDGHVSGGGGSGGVGGSSAKKATPNARTLVVRVKTAEFKDNELMLTNGEFTLQGEDVVVRNGVSYFQGKSQLSQIPSTGPPILTGSMVDRKRLEALASKDGLRNLYFDNSELLDGQRTLIMNPEIHFGNQVIPMESVARRLSSAETIEEEVLNKILPNHEHLSSLAAQRDRALQSEIPDENRDLNKVVMVNGRCILKDNCIVILRGLLHVGCAWHRVINGLLIGSNPADNPHPVTITGTPVYKDASACAQMLLSNITMYSLGSTVYAGNSPLLKDAVLHADGQVLNIADLHRRSICGMEPPEDPEPARLFVQGGKFTVDDSSLNIYEGTVWFKDVKVQLPEDSIEEICVKDSMIFVSPDSSSYENISKGPLNENRDIIYKDNLLFLDDLTPLLKGGFICHEDREQPLTWLSSEANPIHRRSQNSQLIRNSVSEEPSNREKLLTDGTCIVDNNGMYFIEGSMLLHGKKVMIDKGIPLFSSDSKDEDKNLRLGSLPPRLSGRVLLDPEAIKDLGAKSVKGFIVLKNVKLDLTDGKVLLNDKVPIMEECKMIFDHHVFSPVDLGMEPDPLAESKDDSRESGVLSDQTESAKPWIIGGTGRGQHPARTVGGQRGAVRVGTGKTDRPSDGQRTSEMEDSGRGASDGAESSHRAIIGGGINTETQSASGRAGKTQASPGHPQLMQFESPDLLMFDSKGAAQRQRQQRTTAASQRSTGLASPAGGARSAMAGGAPGFDERGLGGEGAGGGEGGRAAANSEAFEGGTWATLPTSTFRPFRSSTKVRQSQSSGAPTAVDGGLGEGNDVEGQGTGTGQWRDSPADMASSPFGDTSSAGMLGNFSVSTRNNKRMIFSLRARIEDTLHFLDLDN